MNLVQRKLPGILGAAALAAVLMALGPVTASAAPNATCAGGSILAGTYRSLIVTGFCSVDSGNVVVQRNLTVAPGGGLLAAFAGSDLSVGRDLLIQSTGLVALGCEPNHFTCFNDLTNTLATHDTIGHNVIANGATFVILHNNTIWGEVAQTGGGGGVNCQLLPLGPPAYTTYEDNTIHGDVTVAGMRTCWAGFFRNTVWGNVNWNNNITWDGTPEPPGDPTVHGDEDGNEITTNSIHGDLNCYENVHAVQFGDSGGVKNVVTGTTRGQCLAVV